MYQKQDFYEGFDLFWLVGAVSDCCLIGLRSDLPDTHFVPGRERGRSFSACLLKEWGAPA